LFDEVETVGMELKDKQKVNGIITGQFRKLCKALEKEGMRLESFEPEISVPAKNVDLWESLAK
jgi:hypothetical protein